jgi:hypothetical protein
MSTAHSPPRDPSAYRPGIHFGERFHDRYEDDRPPRHLDGEIVDGCIEEGEVTEADSGLLWFRETFGGVTYRLVVNREDREVITGYPVSINTEHARQSGRWTSQQIADIREFIATDPRDTTDAP